MTTAVEAATVLVVDDEEDLRDAMRRMLERRGFSTLLAGDTAQAMDVVRSHSGEIKLLLTDLGLAGGSGGDLARSVTGLLPGLPVLFVSGLPKDVAVEKGLVGAADRLLQKPFTSAGLVDAVREALAG